MHGLYDASGIAQIKTELTRRTAKMVTIGTHQARLAAMKPFRWNPDKNETLKIERSISFEEISLAIEAAGLLDILRHPNPEKYPNQSVLVVALDDYVYLVPYVEEPDYYFLKTVIPSRKATRDYLLRSNTDEKT